MLSAHHVRQPAGAGAVIGLDEHVAALTKVVLANSATVTPAPDRSRPQSGPVQAAARQRRMRGARIPAGRERTQ
jgi:hypothetical protein